MPDETPAPVCFAFSGEMWKERREVSTVALVQHIIFGSWSQMHRPKCSSIFDSFILSFCLCAKVELFSLARLCPVSFLLCLRVPKNLPFLSRSQTFSVRAIGQSMPRRVCVCERERERENRENTRFAEFSLFVMGSKVTARSQRFPSPHHTFD